MTKKEIRRAAYHLKSWADVLMDSHKDGSIESEAALSEASEMADLSKKLYAMAREPRQTQLKI